MTNGFPLRTDLARYVAFFKILKSTKEGRRETGHRNAATTIIARRKLGHICDGRAQVLEEPAAAACWQKCEKRAWRTESPEPKYNY